MVTQIEAPIFPPGRYGRRRESRHPRRWASAAVATLVVAVALVLAVVLFQRYGQPTYRPTLTGYGSITDHQITFTFQVTKRDHGPAICLVVAKDHMMAEVGRADVPVPAGDTVVVTSSISTTALATGIQIQQCRAG